MLPISAEASWVSRTSLDGNLASLLTSALSLKINQEISTKPLDEVVQEKESDSIKPFDASGAKIDFNIVKIVPSIMNSLLVYVLLFFKTIFN